MAGPRRARKRINLRPTQQSTTHGTSSEADSGTCSAVAGTAKPRTKQVSAGAVEHGKIRHKQGYTLSMIVEESRILQVSIFQTLQNSLTTVDFSLLLIDVMTIADEVDSQLKQTIVSFTEQIGISAATAI